MTERVWTLSSKAPNEDPAEHYNYFRDYDPSIGRYVESDPIGLHAGLNTYAYVGGQPLSAIDVTGEFALPPIGYSLGVLGGAYAAYSVGMSAINFAGDSYEAYMCYRDQRLAQDALNAAIQACSSYPQGGACNSLGFFRQQFYRAAAASTRAGGNLTADDMKRKNRRRGE